MVLLRGPRGRTPRGPREGSPAVPQRRVPSQARRLHHQLEVGLISHSATEEIVHRVVAIREVVGVEDNALCVEFGVANGDLMSEPRNTVGNRRGHCLAS